MGDKDKHSVAQRGVPVALQCAVMWVAEQAVETGERGNGEEMIVGDVRGEDVLAPQLKNGGALEERQAGQQTGQQVGQQVGEIDCVESNMKVEGGHSEQHQREHELQVQPSDDGLDIHMVHDEDL